MVILIFVQAKEVTVCEEFACSRWHFSFKDEVESGGDVIVDCCLVLFDKVNEDVDGACVDARFFVLGHVFDCWADVAW